MQCSSTIQSHGDSVGPQLHDNFRARFDLIGYEKIQNIYRTGNNEPNVSDRYSKSTLPIVIRPTVTVTSNNSNSNKQITATAAG
jgi:hypothetical protein